jgi:hypothetical protein
MASIRKYLIPALLIAAALWLGWEKGQHGRMTAEARPPDTTLCKSSPRELRDPDERKNSRSVSTGSRHDWDTLAKDLSLRGHLPLPENPSLRAAIEGMSVEELLAAIADLKESGISDLDRAALERELAEAILLRSPERGFSLFADRGRGAWDFFLGGEFSKWVGRDKDAAVAWLASHAAAGGQVSDQMIRQPFFDFLGSDPDTSAAILATRPPEARLESLRSLEMSELKQSGHEEWAKVVRAQLPAGDAPTAIAWPLMNWSDGDGAPMTLAQVDAYMERIQVSDDERKACIMTVAQQIRTWELSAVEGEGEITDFDRMRSWVQRQDSEILESATLAGLREMANRGSFDEAGNLAIQFNEESADDAFLTAVLEAADDRTEPALLRSLIDRLSDPALRERHQAEQAHRLK